MPFPNPTPGLTPGPTPGLGGLMLAARRLVDGLYAGRHASPLRGTGAEFHDYRPYTPGDDPRAVDWKRYGRTDRYYLKRYRRETDLHLQTVVDGSASMSFTGLPNHRGGAAGVSKLQAAKELAAALSVLTLRQGDRAGLSLIDTAVRCHHPPTGSLRQLQPAIAELEKTQAAERAAPLGPAMQQLGQLIRQRGVVAVISDLLDEPEPVLSAIDRLRHRGCDVILFQILTPDELTLHTPGNQAMRLSDPEGPGTVTTRPRAVARRYRQLIDAHLGKLQRAFAARGVDHTLVRTDQPLIPALRRYLLTRSRRETIR